VISMQRHKIVVCQCWNNQSECYIGQKEIRTCIVTKDNNVGDRVLHRGRRCLLWSNLNDQAAWTKNGGCGRSRMIRRIVWESA